MREDLEHPTGPNITGKRRIQVVARPDARLQAVSDISDAEKKDGIRANLH